MTLKNSHPISPKFHQSVSARYPESFGCEIVPTPSSIPSTTCWKRPHTGKRLSPGAARARSLVLLPAYPYPSPYASRLPPYPSPPSPQLSSHQDNSLSVPTHLESTGVGTSRLIPLLFLRTRAYPSHLNFLRTKMPTYQYQYAFMVSSYPSQLFSHQDAYALSYVSIPTCLHPLIVKPESESESGFNTQIWIRIRVFDMNLCYTVASLLLTFLSHQTGISTMYPD